jgi:hypothetical protein
MRSVLVQFVAVSAFLTQASAQTSQTCTGLCQQQVSCPAGQTTSISGTVYAPNGTDPLPNVLVYIPNAPVDAFTAGVSCPVPGQPPSGSPLVGANTAADGTFTLANVPVGSNIPIVIQSGHWRRQLVVPGTASCSNTSFSARMPRNQSEGDIPKIAIATGSVDQIECVLRKVGIDDTEFTNPLSSGRINLYSGDGSPTAPGARIDASTPTEAALMDNIANLKQYDVLMLPCEASAITKSSTRLSNFIQYANAGGRVYASHFSYVWMYNNPPFNTVVNWRVGQATLPDGIATVDTTFPDGQTLATWLQLVGASTTPGQMPISVLRHDFNGVVPPTQSWLTLDNAAQGNPVMQFTFDTPVGAANQCGRILFNEYHVENPPAGTSPTNKAFPTECPAGGMTPQEKLLEYSLFDLTNQGGEPTLDPTTADFGSEPVGFATASKNFTLKNNSIFALSGITASATGDFLITSNGCSTVPAGGTCQVGVAFKPTAVGSRTGTLTVQSNAKSLTAALTGTGVPALSVSPPTTLTFGNIDIGATTTRSMTFTNTAPGPVTVPPLTISGDYTIASTCTNIPAGSSCPVNITFKPTTTGTRTGTLTVSSGDPAAFNLPVQLTGNGVDFTIALNPTSGSVISGLGTQTTATITPVAGFTSSVTISCTTNTPGSTCSTSLVSFIPSSPVPVVVAITTTSQYTVVGYSGFLPLLALFGGTLLWLARRKTRTPALFLLGAFVLTATSLLTTGCSGKYPDKNAVYTAPGSYTYTLTATDGFLTHSATYTLGVTAK